MKRHELEHVLRASAAITGADEFVVIGSQALVGQVADPPAELTQSIEVDVFTFRDPADAELIDGTIGEASPFHRTFGYYAHGVPREVATLPAGWESRLVPLKTERTGGAIGRCLELHDLAVAKLVAGREKDLEFVAALIRYGFLTRAVLDDRLDQTDVVPRLREACTARLRRLWP